MLEGKHPIDQLSKGFCSIQKRFDLFGSGVGPYPNDGDMFHMYAVIRSAVRFFALQGGVISLEQR